MSRLLCQAELLRRGSQSPFTESNRRPSPYHGDALPTELKGQTEGREYTSRSRERNRPPAGARRAPIDARRARTGGLLGAQHARSEGRSVTRPGPRGEDEVDLGRTDLAAELLPGQRRDAGRARRRRRGAEEPALTGDRGRAG